MKALFRRLIPASILRTAQNRWLSLAAWSARRRAVAQGAHVSRDVHGLGWRSIEVGPDAVVGDGCVLNVNHRTRGHVQIRLGAYSFIGAGSFFSPAELIDIGPYGLVGIDCHFLGSGHEIGDPYLPYVASGTHERGRQVMGANCWLGVGVTLLGNITIGHGSVIGAGSFVRSDIPPFSIAVGNPARVVKRYDPFSKRWVPIATFTAEMDEALPDEKSYLGILRSASQNLTMPIRAAGRSQGDLP